MDNQTFNFYPALHRPFNPLSQPHNRDVRCRNNRTEVPCLLLHRIFNIVGVWARGLCCDAGEPVLLRGVSSSSVCDRFCKTSPTKPDKSHKTETTVSCFLEDNGVKRLIFNLIKTGLFLWTLTPGNTPAATACGRPLSPNCRERSRLSLEK